MGDGTFSPDTNVTYSQIVKMLVAALGYTTAAEAAGGYPNGYLQIASSIGVTAGVAGVDADTAVTRGQVAQLIANAVKTPIVAITSWTTDIYGKPVAETEVMDGNGDSEKFQTLLTEYHDTYAVKGRVEATHAQGTVDADQVAFAIEYSDNFDGNKISAKGKDGYDDTYRETIYFGETNAPELLFTYAEALIQKNEDDEYTIISIYPYGKNDIVTLSSDLFEEYSSTAIEFATSATSSKTKTYKLDDADVYVNGIEYTDAAEAIANYVDGNKIGTVTLIDTPAEGSTSKDGKYDYIMIDYQEWAIVDGATIGTSTSKIFFDDYQAGNGMAATLVVDHEEEEDGEKVYTFVKDGAEVALDTLKENDVVLVTYDVTGKLNDSTFVKLEISDKVVEGTIGSRSKDNSDMAIYDVDGVDYSYVGDTAGSYTFAVGNSYIFYVDAKDRIVDFDENATSKNYGIIDRVWKDSNDDNKVRLITADGTREAFIIKKGVEASARAIAYDDEGDLNVLANRLVSYKLNSKNEAYGFEKIDLQEAQSEYKAGSVKVGSAKMNEATLVFDLSEDKDWDDTNAYSASDLVAGSLESFEDGEEYTVLFGDKSTAGFARVVVITEGIASVGVAATFAIVDSVNEGMVDGAERYAFDLLTADSNGEIVSLYIDEDVAIDPDDFNRGDVIVYSLSAAGEMKNIKNIFSAVAVAGSDEAIDADEAYEFLAAQTAISAPGYGDNWFFKSAVDSWNDSEPGDNNGYARVGFGAIVDRTSAFVTFAKVDENGVSKGENVKEVDLAADVNVFVVDFNERDRAGSDRISAGVVGSIAKTAIPDSQLEEDENGEYIYDWSEIDSVDNANYAFYKTIDGEITDILVILPKEAK
jgi:hypothetical protein